ncbi:MAG: D-alanine--D-alanine ligase family protein [bacterium]|jgi:D-alanine-D-alanine ligase
MKILVVMGGLSSESEISIKTGKEISKALSKKYKVVEYIVKDLKEFYKFILDNSFDFIFLALHGKYGEDGIIQAFLDSLNLKYSFSNFYSSFIGFDKMLSNLIVQNYINENNIKNLFIPKSIYLNINYINAKGYNLLDYIVNRIKQEFIVNYVIVKPNSSGSSVGISKVKVDDLESLNNALKIALKEDPNFICIQEYIEGLELSVGVLQNKDKIIPLEVCQLEINNNDIFDYEKKYVTNTKHIIPPNIDEYLLDYIKFISKELFLVFNAKDIVRFDYRLTSDNKLYFLEVNTIPGFTPVSIVPDQAKVSGFSFEDLLDIIINNNITNQLTLN